MSFSIEHHPFKSFGILNPAIPLVTLGGDTQISQLDLRKVPGAHIN